MKYRKPSNFRILYDLSGRRQEEILQYQGFLEVANREGWQVLVISEQVEMQMRELCDRGKVDAVVGNFISEAWLSTLPDQVTKLHMGMNPLGETACVVWDLNAIGRKLRGFLLERGYETFRVFGPQDQPQLVEGLQAEGQFRTSESLREGLSDLRNVAVVCPTDYGARLALNACRSSGIEVPESVGIAGIGGRSLDAVLSETPLTTVVLPYQEKGRSVGELLASQAAGNPGEQIFLPPVRIQPGQSTQKQLNEGKSLVQLLDLLLNGNLQNPPPVEAWARQSGMSRRSYERAFSEEAGCTPYEYLLRLREHEAKRLLRDTSYPLIRIGEMIGVPEPPRFSAFFKQRVGVAPTVWRRGDV